MRLIHPIMVFVAFVGLGNWNLQFDWSAKGHPPRAFNESFDNGRDCVARVNGIVKTMLKTIPGGSRDFRYEWHCLPQGMIF